MFASGSTILPQVSLSPHHDELWRSCHALQNEMVLTGNGRRIFPTLEYIVTGLDPNQHYTLCLHIEQCDNKKLRYAAGKWIEIANTEVVETPRKVWHMNGSALGSQWMARTITFDQLRITNKKSKEDGNSSYVHLQAQLRYIPVVSIYECPPDYAAPPKLVSSYRIAHSQFITVTAYHSEKINTLKTNNNPYSTGSRKDRRLERQSSSPASETSSCDSRPRGSPKAKKIKMEPKEVETPVFPMMPMVFPPNFNMFQAYFQLLSNLAAAQNTLPFMQSFTPPAASPELPFPAFLTPPAESPAESPEPKDSQDLGQALSTI